MSFVGFMNNRALRLAVLPGQTRINVLTKRFRKPSMCKMCSGPQHSKPCFDINRVSWERGNDCHAKIIRSFLYTHYWPREPSVVGLWMNLASPYLEILTERYATTGDRFLAFERLPRTEEKKIAGVLVANKIWPWMIAELEQWAHHTESRPDRDRMYFIAHCYRKANLFKKYNVPYIYDVEILGSSAEVTGHGVATQLLRNVIHNAVESRHPLVHVIAFSEYACKVCERCGMKREWTMEYEDFVDSAGQKVFFPRRPHHTVAVYIKTYDLTQPDPGPCKEPW